ncbi:MAG: AAA family ATPase, partial [Planctomycetota bacterium]
MTRDSADGSLSLEAREMETRSRTLAAKAQCLLEDLGSCYLGARETLVLPLLHAVLAGCHVLLEGMPGLGKTLLAKALASGMGVRFSRIQCTPDLMPS